MTSIANCHVALKRSRASQDFILWCSMCISWMKSLSFFQFLKDFGSMITVEITGVVILVATLAFAPSCDAQSRRRRGSCTPRNFQVSHWSSWNPLFTRGLTQTAVWRKQWASGILYKRVTFWLDKCPSTFSFWPSTLFTKINVLLKGSAKLKMA